MSNSNNRGEGLLKLLVMLVAGPATLLALMTLASLVTSNIWVQLGVAAALALIVPLFIADRLLPEQVEQGRGLPSTVLTLSWVAVPVVVLGLCLGWVSPLLHAEAAILDESALAVAAPVARYIALDEDAPVGLLPEVLEDGSAEAPTNVSPSAPTNVDTSHVPDESTPSTRTATATSASNNGSPVRPSAQESMTPADIYSRWADSVFSIELFRGSEEIGNGTGFCVGRDRVITNHHVIEGLLTHTGERRTNFRVGVQAKDGTWSHNVQILDYDAERDLALLQVDLPGNTPPVRLATDAEVRVGSPAVSIGSPYGLDQTLTDGVVSARRLHDGARWIQVSSPISPGNSGGPIFNDSGDVVGVTTRVATLGFRAQNLNLAVPSSDVTTFLERTPTIDAPIHVGGGGTQASGTW